MNISPVIMCGGIGSRLWPLSTKETPKQFLKLLDSKESLLQRTVKRFFGKKNISGFIFLTNIAYIDLLKEQLSEIGVKEFIIIAEPFSKNTAPALTMASLFVQQYRPNDLIIALPSDSYIGNNEIFIDSMYTAKNYLKTNDKFVLFGIEPTYPEQGFGYMKPLLSSDTGSIKKIEYFFEKPSKENAIKYIENGCLWNSGMVMFNSSLFLQELEQYNKPIVDLCKASYENSFYENEVFVIDPMYFSKVSDISVDYALLERSSLSSILPIVGMHWNDIGSWKAVYDLSLKDSNGNVLVGNVRAFDCYNCYIYSPDCLTAVVGLKNKIVINVKDSCLHVDKDECQNIKYIYDK